MFRNLGPGAIGIRGLGLADAIALARETGFEGLKHPFLPSSDGMLDLIEQIGAPNVGLLVDAWHVYTSHGRNDDVARLRPEQVVVVHVNDAPAGIAIDEQDDHTRRLPVATGLIDLAGFMGALRRIGYD